MTSFGQLARGHVELMNRVSDSNCAFEARKVVRLSRAHTLALQKLTSTAIDVVAQIAQVSDRFDARRALSLVR